MGAYGLIGAGTGTVLWDYANRLPVVQDGVETTVGDDRINHFDFFAGAGVSLMQFRHLHIGANLTGGVRFCGWHTYQGFENTELPTTGTARLMLETSFRWRGGDRGSAARTPSPSQSTSGPTADSR